MSARQRVSKADREFLAAQKPQPKDDRLDETNFRESAQRVIAAYEKKNMFIDALLWSQIIGFYNNALDELTAELASARKKANDG